jgi:hypothetical protein
MPAIINPKITDAGKAAAVNAAANGLQVAITHIALGTGQYDAIADGAAMTAMAGRKEFVPIGAGLVTGSGGFRVHVRFESWAGVPNPYDATELGFYIGNPDAGGVLFAVHSHPSDVLVQRNSLDYVASFNLQITDVPAGSVTILIDPDEAQLLALLAQHEAAANPHPVYVRKSGDTSTGPQLGVTATQHDDSTKFATTAFAKRIGVSFPSSGSLAITGNTTLTAAHMGRWGDIQAGGAAVTLPLASTCPVGASMTLRVSSLSGLLVAQGADKIVAPITGEASSLQIIQGETITLTRDATGKWQVTGVSARMPAGLSSFFPGNAAPSGWLEVDGALLSRVAYPRLYQFAVSVGLVTEAQWWDGGYSGRFSSGTDSTNFRMPDARSAFIRALDNGRGIDIGRIWGTYQAAQNLSHTHTGESAASGAHVHSITDPGHTHGYSANPINVPGGAEGGNRESNGASASTTASSPTGISINSAGSHAHDITINASGGADMRPGNIAWVFCMTY